MTPSKFCVSLTLALTLVIATASLAHDGAHGIVKERMDFMKNMGQTMKVMSHMMKGERPMDPALFAEKATDLSAMAKKLPGYFPEGSMDPISEAIPAIWKKWDTFVEHSAFMEAESLKMADTIKATDGQINLDVKLQFSRMSSSCGQCHRKFREKK